MAKWNSITLDINPFQELKPPLQALLQALEALEAILQALLDLIKIFLQDILNPLRALIALLLAAIRAIINQIRATGFAFLLVHPDFNRLDFDGVIDSVGGAYPTFESKVVAKFFDTGDLFRPTYPPGSAVAMLVLYIGVDSPGDLLGLIAALIALFRSPSPLAFPPAPVNVQVNPVNKSGNSVAQFRKLFDSDLQQALVVEWQMPMAPVGTGPEGVINQFTNFINRFRFPSFIVERTRTPGGAPILKRLESQQLGPTVFSAMERTVGINVSNNVALREQTGLAYRHFDKRILVSGTELLNGFLTGTFKFLDEFVDDDDDPIKMLPLQQPDQTFGSGQDPPEILDETDVLPGDAVYYRIRAVSGGGNFNDYINEENDKPDAFARDTDLVKQESNTFVVNFGNNVAMSPPSQVVRAIVPETATAVGGFNPYNALFDAVRAGILLNFDMPAANQRDPIIERRPRNREPYSRADQKVGWGTLSMVGAQVGALKLGFPTAKDLTSGVGKLVLDRFARRISNAACVDLYAKVDLKMLLSKKWRGPNPDTPQAGADRTDGLIISNPEIVRTIAEKVLQLVGIVKDDGFFNQGDGQPPTNRDAEFNSPVGTVNWTFIGITGGSITEAVNKSIDRYLSEEDEYDESENNFSGPLPIQPAGGIAITVEERDALAEFLRIALSSLRGDGGYLVWYSVTVGDLFPPLTAFLFDFEQFIKDLLKAIESAVKELTDIIENLIDLIRMLQEILRILISIIDLLNITLRVSVLTTVSTNGSATSLANTILTSDDKPGTSPFGLHSGIVLTAGGPGEGFIQALKAILFIVTAGQVTLGADN